MNVSLSRAMGIVGVVLLAATSALAQRPVYEYKSTLSGQCLKADPSSRLSTINRCTQAEHARQTQRMLTALGALQPLMDGWQRKHLKRVQEAWERWKDLRCFFIDDEQGSGAESHSEAEECLANTTAERADELQAMRSLIAPGTQP